MTAPPTPFAGGDMNRLRAPFYVGGPKRIKRQRDASSAPVDGTQTR